ncbi:MAG: ComEC/Rec2 family competence protein, partial [OM182 bacterium]
FAVSRLSSRRFGVITGLLFALTFVLVLSPLAATGSGFWLSFVAVSVLVLFAASPQRAPLEESGNDTQLLSSFLRARGNSRFLNLLSRWDSFSLCSSLA